MRLILFFVLSIMVFLKIAYDHEIDKLNEKDHLFKNIDFVFLKDFELRYPDQVNGIGPSDKVKQVFEHIRSFTIISEYQLLEFTKTNDLKDVMGDEVEFFIQNSSKSSKIKCSLGEFFYEFSYFYVLCGDSIYTIKDDSFYSGLYKNEKDLFYAKYSQLRSRLTQPDKLFSALLVDHNLLRLKLKKIEFIDHTTKHNFSLYIDKNIIDPLPPNGLGIHRFDVFIKNLLYHNSSQGLLSKEQEELIRPTLTKRRTIHFAFEKNKSSVVKLYRGKDAFFIETYLGLSQIEFNQAKVFLVDSQDFWVKSLNSLFGIELQSNDIKMFLESRDGRRWKVEFVRVKNDFYLASKYQSIQGDLQNLYINLFRLFFSYSPYQNAQTILNQSQEPKNIAYPYQIELFGKAFSINKINGLIYVKDNKSKNIFVFKEAPSFPLKLDLFEDILKKKEPK